jgi:hypothetical protein
VGDSRRRGVARGVGDCRAGAGERERERKADREASSPPRGAPGMADRQRAAAERRRGSGTELGRQAAARR